MRRRMEVYSAIYNVLHNEVRKIEAQVLDETSFDTYLKNETVYFVGNGVEKTKTLIKHSNAVFVEDKFPSANEMSKLAYDKYKKNDIEDVAYFEPYYFKRFYCFKAKILTFFLNLYCMWVRNFYASSIKSFFNLFMCTKMYIPIICHCKRKGEQRKFTELSANSVTFTIGAGSFKTFGLEVKTFIKTSFVCLISAS